MLEAVTQTLETTTLPTIKPKIEILPKELTLLTLSYVPYFNLLA